MMYHTIDTCDVAYYTYLRMNKQASSQKNVFVTLTLSFELKK